MFCSQCGTKIGDDAKFCPNCGTKVLNIPVPAAPAAKPVAESTVQPVAENAVQPVAEPVAENVVQPVAEPVAENVVQPVAEPVAENVVQPIAEPVVESAAPAVEPVTQPVAEPEVENVVQPVVEPVVESAVQPVAEPLVENVVQPVAEPVAENVVQPVVEPVAESATSAAQPVAPTPQPVAPTPQPVAPAPQPAEPAPQPVTPAPQPAATAPVKKKKKPKVWLIILIVIGGLILLCGCGGIIAALIGLTNLKKYQNLSNFQNQLYGNTSEVVSEIDSENNGRISSSSPDHEVSIDEINAKVYTGKVEITEVTGADALIDYLEEVSGAPLSEDEKDQFRFQDISNRPETEITIFDDENSNCGWQIAFPFAFQTGTEMQYISDLDMLTYAEIDEGTHFDEVGIHPNNNSFALKNQVPDEGDYAPAYFGSYADYMRNGQFGIQFVGKIVNSETEGEYGMEGLYQIMFWYDTMTEPYVITYKYDVDYYDSVTGEEIFDEDIMDFEEPDMDILN